MARVKPKRHGIVTDMTAMCDVAFLLLTFFILTTQFKKPDVEPITTPSSTSETLLPEKNLMTVDITPDGRFFLQLPNNNAEKVDILSKMGEKYHVPFTDEDKANFTKIEAINVPITQLSSFLNLPEDEKKSFKSPTGVPMDSANKQLIDWIQTSLTTNPEYKLAIKGDGTTNYKKVKSLFDGLRDINFYTFWLITSQEVAN